MKKILRHSVISAAAGALFAFVLPGCGGGDLLSGDNQERAELERGRALWRAAGVRRYAFTADYFAGQGPRTVLRSQALEGMVITSSAQDAASGTERDATELTAVYGTVERMFDAIEDALDDGDLSVDAEYDVARGFPVSISTTTVNPNDTEDSVDFTVTDFDLIN